MGLPLASRYSSKARKYPSPFSPTVGWAQFGQGNPAMPVSGLNSMGISSDSQLRRTMDSALYSLQER